MQKIVPSLWFDHQTEEAVNFYVSLLPASRIVSMNRIPAGPAKGNAIAVFELAGQRFMAFDGGPYCTFTHAISFTVHCETQREIDDLWERLSAEGDIEQCGWLKDKYGVSWQIVPAVLGELMSGDDPARAQRVMDALLGMTKIEIDVLKNA